MWLCRAILYQCADGQFCRMWHTVLLVASTKRASECFSLSASKTRSFAYGRQGVLPGVVRDVISSLRMKLNRASEDGSPCFNPRCISISETGDPPTQIIVAVVVTVDISSCQQRSVVDFHPFDGSANHGMWYRVKRFFEDNGDYGERPAFFSLGPHEVSQTRCVNPSAIVLGEPSLQLIDLHLC